MIIPTRNAIIFGTAGLLAIAATAATTYYVTRHSITESENASPSVAAAPQPAPVQARHRQDASRQQAAAPKCNDSNIVGTLAGGVLGGIVGNQFGHGSGRAATTIGGTLGGAYVGNQYIPTRNVTCRNGTSQ